MNLFDTLDNKRKTINLSENKKIKIYVCGITPYSESHIGHAMSAVIFDTLRKYLLANKQNVTYVQNFTDIDDKLIKAAEENNTDIKTISTKFINKHLSALSKLNVLEPDYSPKATEEIKEMINMIQALISKGMAYEIDGDCFFRVEKFETYGKLSKRNFDEMLAGARIEIDERNENPMDFALWKTKTGNEPGWESPWGEGRPGWHIECSAMSMKYLGQNIDIHGGGRDLIFPHHENEIAQSCGCTGKQPVRYWVHNGFVNIDKEKMSKSLGNFFTLRDVYKKYHPEVLRLFLISSQYRSPIDFSEKNLEDATKVMTRFYEGLAGINEKFKGLDINSISGLQKKVKEHPLTKSFETAMNDDLNTAVVMAHLNEGLRNLNSASIDEEFAITAHAWIKAAKVLGLFASTPEKFKEELFSIKKENLDLDIEKIEQLITDRNIARKSKNWAEADRCRDELTAIGVLIEDTANGTEWKIK